jgi:sugar lactone lactonase YvrE
MRSLWLALAASSAFSTFAVLLGCSQMPVSPAVDTPPASHVASATAQHVYAFVPNKLLVATYAEGSSPLARPISVLTGAKTRLSTGNGMAVDSDGTSYVIVYDAASSGSPLDFLAFAPNAHGNTAPERVAVLKGSLLAGYAVGLALDGHGNFWMTSIGRLMRYPTSASGTAKPNASISLQLQTPDGLMPAHAGNVATDSAGDVYCACTVVYHGNQAIGVSEYAADARGKFTLVRSFYDFNLPEVPPSSIAIDPSGTMYLASSLPNTGIFAYRAGTQTGNVHYWRRFVSGSDTAIYSLATDATGRVYAASGSHIIVYGAHANGHVRPLRTINDPRHLDYASGEYGTLLSVR